MKDFTMMKQFIYTSHLALNLVMKSVLVIKIKSFVVFVAFFEMLFYFFQTLSSGPL